MMHDNSNNSGNNRNYTLLLPVISITVSESGRCAIHLSSVLQQRKSDIIARVIRSRFDYGKRRIQSEISTSLN